MNPIDDRYLSSKHVRERYGNVSHMWIERRLVDSQFPVPVYFGRRRFWKLSDLLEWERQKATCTPK